MAGNFPATAWPEPQGSYIIWDHLLHRLVTILLYKKEKYLGMLNPFADIFILQNQQVYNENIAIDTKKANQT